MSYDADKIAQILFNDVHFYEDMMDVIAHFKRINHKKEQIDAINIMFGMWETRYFNIGRKSNDSVNTVL